MLTQARDYRLLSTLSAGTALIVAFTLLAIQHWYEEKRAFIDALVVDASIIGANTTAALTFGDARAAAEILATVERVPSVVSAELHRTDGTPLATYRRAGEAAPQDSHSSPGIREIDGMVVVNLPVTLERNELGTVVIRARLDSFYRGQAQFALSLLITTAIAVLLGHLASRRLRQRMAAAERELQRMALFDPVTGLANRHAFEMALEQTVRRHQREGGASALLFVDVDGFKKVNDRFGHQIGDQVLRGLGGRLQIALRSADVVARIGGDEFGAILVGTGTPDDAARVAENLIRIAAEPFHLGAAIAHVGLSVGIAVIPDDGESADELMHRADLAMYHAKQMGKGNHQFFSDNLGHQVRRRLDIETALRAALAAKELHVVYQPQTTAPGAPLDGLEALVRWHHAERGFVSPGEFIPIAEESGLILDVGRFVLARVCRDIRELRSQGWRVPPVAINISARQLLQGDIVSEIPAALAAEGLSSRDIEIELTESVLMDRIEDHRAMLDDLSEAGIRIAIDDFGTGYSSLNYLRQLPVDKLKIDMSFVRDLPDNAESVAIVGGIIVMAHALGLRVVAEGVETAEQIECLTDCGCDLLQGYFTGRPMDRDALTALLERV